MALFWGHFWVFPDPGPAGMLPDNTGFWQIPSPTRLFWGSQNGCPKWPVLAPVYIIYMTF